MAAASAERTAAAVAFLVYRTDQTAPPADTTETTNAQTARTMTAKPSHIGRCDGRACTHRPRARHLSHMTRTDLDERGNDLVRAARQGNLTWPLGGTTSRSCRPSTVSRSRWMVGRSGSAATTW